MPVIAYRDALNQAIDEEMARDERVILIGGGGAHNRAYKVNAACTTNTATAASSTPISEEGFTGVGIGAAMTGLPPVVE